jgi:hypothetical protein
MCVYEDVLKILVSKLKYSDNQYANSEFYKSKTSVWLIAEKVCIFLCKPFLL